MLINTSQFGHPMDEQQDFSTTARGNQSRGQRLGAWLALSLLLHVGAFGLLILLVPELDLPSARQIALELVRGAGEPVPDEVQPHEPASASAGPLEPAYESDPTNTNSLTSGRFAVNPAPRSSPAPIFVHVSPSSAVATPSMPVGTSSDDRSAEALPSPLTDDPQVIASVRLDYLSWLEQHKRYPLAARRRGLEGAVLVRFVVDREGRLLERGLLQSSGSRHLDQAALELLSRASPFPILPPSLDADRLEIELPIEYRLSDT